MELSSFKYNNTALALKIIFKNYTEGNPKGTLNYPIVHKQLSIQAIELSHCPDTPCHS